VVVAFVSLLAQQWTLHPIPTWPKFHFGELPMCSQAWLPPSTPPHSKLSYWTIHTLIIISIFLINQLNQRGYYPTPLNGKLATTLHCPLPHPLPIMGLIVNFGATFSENIRASLECLDSRAKVKYHPCWYLVLSFFGGQDHTLNQCFLVENNSNGGVQSNTTSLL